MPRSKHSDQLTPLELEIMKVLWQTGPASVQAVPERLGDSKPIAYTTVQTMLNVLCRKGKVKRALVDRAFHYRPAVTKQKAVGSALSDMVQRLFGGSAEDLVIALMDSKQLTPDALRKLNEMVDREEMKR